MITEYTYTHHEVDQCSRNCLFSFPHNFWNANHLKFKCILRQVGKKVYSLQTVANKSSGKHNGRDNTIFTFLSPSQVAMLHHYQLWENKYFREGTKFHNGHIFLDDQAHQETTFAICGIEVLPNLLW